MVNYVNILSSHLVICYAYRHLYTMALFHFIFSNYFNEFLEYNHIQELQLPLWLYALAGLFVLAITLWTILVVRGLNNFIHQVLNSSSFKGNNDGSAIEINDAGGDGEGPIWAHIKPRPPTRSH